MKKLNPSRTLATRLFAGMLLAGTGSALADVHCVDVNSTNATPPYTNWTTAATNIQDAVDAAVAGDEIVVTNGIYAIGGRTVSDGAPNRVAVDKPLGLQSINGPQFTVIDGARSVRCVYLTNGASLSGFTLTNGSVYNGCPCYYYGGGGAYGGIHGVLDVRGGGGPVGVGRRGVDAVHVHVMHLGQGALPQKNTKSTKRGAQPNRFEQEKTEETESGVKRARDTNEWAADFNGNRAQTFPFSDLRSLGCLLLIPGFRPRVCFVCFH